MLFEGQLEMLDSSERRFLQRENTEGITELFAHGRIGM